MVMQELHRDLLFGRGFCVLRGLPVPPAVSFECVPVALHWRLQRRLKPLY